MKVFNRNSYYNRIQKQPMKKIGHLQLTSPEDTLKLIEQSIRIGIVKNWYVDFIMVQPNGNYPCLIHTFMDGDGNLCCNHQRKGNTTPNAICVGESLDEQVNTLVEFVYDYTQYMIKCFPELKLRIAFQV